MIAQKDTWFIAHNGAEIVHYGFVEVGKSLNSGQPIIEEFDDEEEWRNRLLNDFGVVPDDL